MGSVMGTLALLVAAAWGQEGPATYQVQAAQSALDVLVRYDRSAAMAGHDHVLRGTGVTGSVTWDPANPAACDVKLSFPVSSLAVDPAGARAKAGLAGETSEGDKRKILENALGKSQLDAAAFPTISFQSSRCAAAGDKTAVSGTLKVHGVGKAVTATMVIRVEGSTLAASGAFSATHEDFGMKPFTALLGALRNDTNLKFTVDVRATR